MKKLIFSLAVLFGLPVMAADGFYYGFVLPQDSTRARVWWFHGQTVTTREGVTADLEALKKAGVGGVEYYDQVQGTPSTDAYQLFSAEWWKMLIFSAQEAKRLHLSFEINMTNGYAAGGKWITPECSMQRLNNSEVIVDGGKNVSINLPLDRRGKCWHSDVAVLALPCPDEPQMARSITYSAQPGSVSPTESMIIPGPPSDHFYGEGYKELPPIGYLEASDDSIHFHRVCSLPAIYKGMLTWKTRTVAFPTVKARYFRCNIKDWSVSSSAMINNWELKSGLQTDFIFQDTITRYTSKEVIRHNQILDITSLMDQNGNLHWHAPKGTWKIIRFYSVSTGGLTKHGLKEGLGLESDKLSKRGALLHWKSYVQPVVDSIRNHSADICGIELDSHEAGSQNWTIGFENEFFQYCGYNLMKYLPVMAGYVVDSEQKSDSVLTDVRRTISYLVGARYLNTFERLCQENNLTFTAQAIGGADCIPVDLIAAKQYADRPQSEFWSHQKQGNYDVKECSSAAHVYDKTLASAESFTDVHYEHTFSYLKGLADYAFERGINDIMACASAYQARLDSIPGNTSGGRQYALNRNNTYWKMSEPFWDYLARCCYMLRQGKSVNDLAVYIGGDAPARILSNALPIIPSGFDFDAISEDALLHRPFPYRALLLQKNALISAQAQTRIDDLRKQEVAIGSFEGLHPDIILPQGHQIGFCHRRLIDGDIYFVVNHEDKSLDGKFSFRAKGKMAELWDPVTGERFRLTTSLEGEYTTTNIHLASRQSYFVVFGSSSSTDMLVTYHSTSLITSISVTGKWKLSFDEKMGGPAKTTFSDLTDWTKNADQGVKYYSGTAIYENQVKIEKQTNDQYYLHFNQLCDVASIKINGKDAGIIWCSPYELDITPYIHQGNNKIEIVVANSLINRMIGDQQSPSNHHYTSATTSCINANSRLKPSGIIGPVTLDEVH